MPPAMSPPRPPAPDAPRATGPIVYPSEDDVAETLLHLDIRSLLRTVAKVWLAAQPGGGLVLSAQVVHWIEGDEKRNLAPDLLVIPGEAPTRAVTSWKDWEEDRHPTFAMEIVSDDIDKDYVTVPPRYDDLGVEELVIYDPLVPAKGKTRRLRWQVYRREGGSWAKVHEGSGDRVESRSLGCWLREVFVDGQRRVRLATGPEGQDLVPTPEESATERARELEAEIARLRAALRDRDR